MTDDNALPVSDASVPADENPLPAAPEAPNAAVPFDLAVIEAEHARWLESEGKEGKRANFRGFDLSGMDMSGRHLVEASLRGTILTGANLSGADLRTADLAEAVLDGANLSGALLSGASLARAQLHQTNASGADLTTANFTAAIAEGINLIGAKLNGAILRDANFRHADFTHALLRDANFRGATLVEANLRAADLSAADCRDVNFDRTSFAGALLTGTNFRGAKLGDVDLQAADFSVALDVATEFQAQSLQSERTKLQEEQAQMASWRADLEAREQLLAADKTQIDEHKAAIAGIQSEQAELALTLGKISRGFAQCFVLWLVIAGLLLALIGIRAAQLDIARIMGAVTGAVFVVLLALFSMLRSVQAARITKKFVIARAQKLKQMEENAPLKTEPVLSSSPVAGETEAAAPPEKKPRFSFLKKK